MDSLGYITAVVVGAIIGGIWGLRYGAGVAYKHATQQVSKLIRKPTDTEAVAASITPDAEAELRRRVAKYDEEWKEGQEMMLKMGALTDSEFAVMVRSTKHEHPEWWSRTQWLQATEAELNLRLLLAGLNKRKI